MPIASTLSSSSFRFPFFFLPLARLIFFPLSSPSLSLSLWPLSTLDRQAFSPRAHPSHAHDLKQAKINPDIKPIGNQAAPLAREGARLAALGLPHRVAARRARGRREADEPSCADELAEQP